MTTVICGDLAGKNLAPGRSYPDSGYLSAVLVVTALAAWDIALVGPLLADTSAQARAGNGYARADFAIDYDGKTVTCPQGKTSASWTPCTQRGTDAIAALFSAADCGPCPARALCTTGRRRQLTLPPRAVAEAQAAARAADRGLPKIRLDHVYMACALNLLRLHAYWTGTPLDRRRTSHLARLELELGLVA
jgi:hypothetical protein